MKGTEQDTTLSSNNIEKAQALKNLYARSTASKLLLILIGTTATVILAITAIYLGAIHLSLERVLRSLAAGILPFDETETDKLAYSVVWNLRLPRIVGGIIAGAGLAVTGAVLQGVLRNPLVSPWTIGISAAAGFGATVAIVLGHSVVGGSIGTHLIFINAFVFCMLTAFLILGISNLRGMTPETPILAGVAISYVLIAFTSLLQYMADERQVAAVLHWSFGSLVTITWKDLLPMLVTSGVGILLLFRYSWELNAMGSGDETAISMGVNVRYVRGITMLLAALVAAGIISFTGIIGFVCLMSPHMSRMLVGNDHRFLIPCSGVIGALLLLGADTIGRTIFAPLEIPVGIVLSFIGVPFFFYLFLTMRRQYWQ